MENEEKIPEKQAKKQEYDWLKPTQFKPGQSGNPKGRPPGKSLKTWLREYFESLDDEGKMEFFKNVDPEMAWRMAEGNPQTNTDLTSKGKEIGVTAVNWNITDGGEDTKSENT